ncbi:MAG: hypothetical protein JJ938_07245 [Roseicyclus sp.]|nr:hypothetical protein [Roseicyclus sp.]MBO6624657.1 hypothetical protein [Roseicyclus sp.]MBO6921649.1 hypothetical protein [Roseicyclus sp.]
MTGLPVWARFALINVALPWCIALFLAWLDPEPAVSVISVYIAAMLILILNVGQIRTSPEWRWVFGVVMLANLACTMLFGNVALATAFGSILLALQALFGLA